MTLQLKLQNDADKITLDMDKHIQSLHMYIYTSLFPLLRDYRDVYWFHAHICNEFDSII